jgi:superfamily I DNA/RNA helicase
MPLTAEQRSALWTPAGAPFRDHRVVSARPGSGKTTTLTDYCLEIASDWRGHYAPWQGMAVMSYTNVAKDELERKVRKLGKANALLSPPHFIGTVDAFVNQFIFLPFGAEFTGCSSRPKLVGEPFGLWNSPAAVTSNKPESTVAFSPAFFDCYGVDLDGSPVRIDDSDRQVGQNQVPVQRVSAGNSSKIIRMKEYVWSHGYATQNDASYISYRTLSESDALTRSLINRFPVLVIDEAQDMTAVQHALVDHLKRSGQMHVVLVGDEYQAIYEWNTARPQLFVAKKDDADWNATSIADTFRCSPAICATLNNLASDGALLSPAPEGTNGEYTDSVQVRSYRDDAEQEDIRLAIDEMAKILSGKAPHNRNGDKVKTLAVIARSKRHISDLCAYFSGDAPEQAKTVIWRNKFAKDYMRVVFFLSQKDLHRAVEAYEIMLFNMSEHRTKRAMRTAFAAEWSSDESQDRDYRTTLIDDLRMIMMSMRAQEGPLTMASCGSFCNVQLTVISSDVLRQIKQECLSFANTKVEQNQLLSTLFAAKDERKDFPHDDYGDVKLLFSTVHGIKGETYDGVIFYTRAATKHCECEKRQTKWADILQHSLIECETKRIAYVALSRAAQMLFVLAPASTTGAWEALT